MIRLNDIEPLLNANRILASTLELNDLLQIVLKLAAQVVEAETASILLLDEKTNELVFDVALGEVEKKLKTIRLKLGEGIAGWVAKENQPLIVNDPSNDLRWTRRADEKTKFMTRSILCVPVAHQGKLLGVIQAINRKDTNGFSQEDRVVLEAFASQTAVAIQNARLFSSLRQEKEKVETIFSQMVEGAIFSDEEGDFVIANSSASNLLSLSDHKILKNNLWKVLDSFTLNPPLDFLKKQNLVSFEALRKEGKMLILSGMIKKILSDKKELVGYLMVFRDVTTEKKEEGLKRNFLSLISHKLKTPLVAITGYAVLLVEDERLDSLEPFFKKAFQTIYAQGIHLKKLVEKLISFSMVEAKEIRIEKRSNVVKKMTEEIITGMKPILEEKKAVVTLDASLDLLPTLAVDYDKFSTIVENLVENGIKFNSHVEKEISISGKSENGSILISVKDNGVGIPPEEQNKIFQKFYQIEESFTGQVEGAGLGLALVKRLVEEHGGVVRVESKMGVGSTFTTVFPEKNSDK